MMNKIRVAASSLAILLFAVFCYLIPSKLSPTEVWQKAYAPWFGMPAKVISLEKKEYASPLDYSEESHYVLELSETQAESWKSRFEAVGVDVEEVPQGFSTIDLFALHAPDIQIKVNEFNLQRQRHAAVLGHAYYALDIEYGDWDADDIPLLEIVYPEYVTPVSRAYIVTSIMFAISPLLLSLSLVLFIWPSIWRDSMGVMVLKSAPICSVLSFVMLSAAIFADPASILPYLYFCFFSYAVLLSIFLTFLASIVCGLRYLYDKYARKV